MRWRRALGLLPSSNLLGRWLVPAVSVPQAETQTLSLRTQPEAYGKSELTPGTQGWASRTEVGAH